MTGGRAGRLWAATALAAAVWLGTAGVVWGTWAVGGSDSSCYALMAEAFASGALQPASEWADGASWPDLALTLAPGGFLPGTVDSSLLAARPICAPGFSVLLAPFRMVGGRDAIFLVTPIAAALLVWFTFTVSRALGGGPAGAAAAILMATSPTALFQTVQPMNDVTTAMLWMAVLATCLGTTLRPFAIGLLIGLALLVRPNLAPVAAVVALWMFVTVWRSTPGLSPVIAATGWLAAGAAPGLLVLVWLNTSLYGSPLGSGYGSPQALFASAHVPPNLQHYGRALVETQTPFMVLALLAPAVCRPAVRSRCWLALGMAVAVTVIYLLYQPYPEWWYLRFLLPAIAIGLALACATAQELIQKAGGARWLWAAGAAAVVALAVYGLRTADTRLAFDLHALEYRFRATGQAVRDRLGEDVVAFTVWDSGSIRYHAGRKVVAWNAMDPAALDASLTWLREHGYSPVIIVERWEEPLFRARFAGRSAVGGLDWPPRVDIARQVRIFDPADRAPYFAGALMRTESVP